MKTSVVIADGTFTTTTAPLTGTYDRVAAEAADIGYQALQLTVKDPRQVDKLSLLKACREHKLSISGIATGLAYSQEGLWLAAPEAEIRQAAIERMSNHIQLSYELAQSLGEAPRVIIGAIRGYAKDCGGSENFTRLISDSINRLLEQAAAQQVEMIFEAIDYLESDMYRDVRETVDFIKSFHSPYFLLQLDTMHMLYEKQDIDDSLVYSRDILAQVDISDDRRNAPDGKNFDFPRLIKKLKELDYQDYLVFEYRPTANGAQQGYDYIAGLINGK